MKASEIALNVIFGVLLSGLLAPLLVMLPDRIRGDGVAWLLALGCIGVVFYLRRNKSRQ